MHAGDTPEGAEILGELPGGAGVVLRGALRDFMLWLELTPESRNGAFAADAGEWRANQLRAAAVHPDLWVPLGTLAEMVRDPVGGDVTRLTHALRSIARWGDEHGAPLTQLAYTQSLSLLRPWDPKLALEVARLARDSGQFARAESWFRHAVRLARSRDWESYVWAFIGLGVQYLQVGNWPAARVVLERALRSAGRRRKRELQAVAHHHLFHLATEARRLPDAYAHVKAAVSAYGPTHPNLPGLVADVGKFWLCMGEHRRALPLFEVARDRIADANVRAMVAANAAQAAAGSGDADKYERVRETAVALIRGARGTARMADTYEALARADLQMGEWGRCEETASQALSFASATGNAEVRLAAESILDLARARAGRVAPPTRAECPVETPGIARQAERLAEELTQVLPAA